MAGKVGCLGEENRRSIRGFAHGTGFSVKCAKAAEFPHSTVANFVKKRVLSANCTTPAMAPFPPVFQFRRTRNLGMAPKSAGNLRAEASSEDLEGVKYIHSQRVMGRTGDTRRCPRPPPSSLLTPISLLTAISLFDTDLPLTPISLTPISLPRPRPSMAAI